LKKLDTFSLWFYEDDQGLWIIECYSN